MLLVDCPINSTQVNHSVAASSHHSLELSRIDRPYGFSADAQLTSVVSEDMVLTNAGRLPVVDVSGSFAAGDLSSGPADLKCHCGKECTRYVGE